MQLSEAQEKAVQSSGSPTLVVAGAGSGKTRTLTAKIARLVAGGYEPERILAITFTNKAADEMKARLVTLTGLPPGRFPWVRTYHSACFRILKTHCQLLGFSPPLQVWAGYQQLKILKDIVVGDLNYDRKHVSAVLSRISKAKNSGNPLTYLDTQRHASPVPIAQVYSRYEQALREANAVDFDNILLLTRDLLRDHPQIKERYQDHFCYVLVDEYQDTNNLQEELTRLFVNNGNLFCVGDDWQAIYSFRGSNLDHFLSFKQNYPDARLFRLEQNYRSANKIVQIANTLIDGNRHQLDKRCFSNHKGGKVVLKQFYDENEEAAWVATKVRSLAAKNIPLETMAVLYRTKFSSLAFEQTFRRLGIRYHLLGGKGFFERKEIMDINCYLTAAAFPKDDASFERIVNIPKRGIGAATLLKIGKLKTENMGLQEASRLALKEKVLAPRIYKSLRQVLNLLDDIRELAPAEAIDTVIKRVKYREYLQQFAKGGSMEYTSRVENIEQLEYSAARYDQLTDYLEEATLVKEDRADEASENGQGVCLSTVHASKGLEYRIVFVIACEEQIFPHWRSLETEAGLEEERRLMYVSVTRAEKELYLSCAGYRKGQFNIPSRFLQEIGLDAQEY